MKTIMGTECYTTKEAASLYGGSGYCPNAFHKALPKLRGCPCIQPTGVNGRMYFPKVAFETWLAKNRIGG